MVKEKASTRLRNLMIDKGLRQVDLLEKSLPYQQLLGTKISRGQLSDYVNGNNEPGMNKIAVLAETLDVSDLWLMGYEVPQKRIGHLYDPDDKKTNTSADPDLEKMLEGAEAFDGKPMTEHDRNIILSMIRAYMENKDDKDGSI